LRVIAAKRLPYCDHIVALSKEGKISEQGAFDKLNAAGGYVSSFNLASPDWEYTPEKHEYEAPPKYTERQVVSQVTEEEIQAEANRRTGDVAIYRYYIGSVGWIPTMIFIVSCSIFIFGISFPCKSSLLLPRWYVADHAVLAIWVKLWAEYNEKHPNQRLGFYLGIYSMLGAISFLFLSISCW
jgi:ATP-binding cassette subfamily C (CFTR/MRP) protein 1